MPNARSAGLTLAGWLIWAVVATAAGYALGVVELEALSIVRFLVIVAAIALAFEVVQSRIQRWLERRKMSSKKTSKESELSGVGRGGAKERTGAAGRGPGPARQGERDDEGR